DEDLHFDLITQHSHARLPRTFDLLKDESLTWIVPYASPEFLQRPDQFPDAKFPPPLWKQSPSEAAPELAATEAAWSTEINFESSQPPMYYALASVWWRIGQRIGLTGIQALYWIRFLNVPLIAIVVWLGCADRDYCKTVVDRAAKAPGRTHSACRAHPLCGNPNCQLDDMD